MKEQNQEEREMELTLKTEILNAIGFNGVETAFTKAAYSEAMRIYSQLRMVGTSHLDCLVLISGYTSLRKEAKKKIMAGRRIRGN